MQQLAPCPSQQPRPIPYGLVSLWDMLQIKAQHYIDLGGKIASIRTVFHIAETHTETEPERQLKPEEVSDLKLLLRELRDICAQIPLNHSYEMLRHFRDDPPRTAREIDIIVRSIRTELQARTFLCLSDTKALYYDHDGLLSPPARDAFPQLTQELRSAGNCYAFEQPTACIFHCMRALEYALTALAKDVNLTWTKEQWHTIIEMIESEIERERRSLPRGVPKDERLNFLSQAAKEFFYFKDGWRNYVSHNRINYQDTQALQALEHVKALVEHLATKLRE